MRHHLRLHAPYLLVWTAVWALFYGSLLLGVEHLIGGDTTGQYHAFALYQAREMRQLRLPVWSPYSYGGAPFAADVQAAVLYPPRWVTILLSAPSGDLPYHALEWEALLHVWLGGVFVYALAHHITRNRRAALLGAILYALGGYLGSYPLLQVPILETVIWLPLALWLLRRAVASARPWPWLAAAGAALGISALAGHPQTWLHGAYLCLAYYLWLTRRAGWAWHDLLRLGVAMAAIALGLAAAAWAPAASYLRFTSREGVGYGFVSTGLPALDYMQALLPGVLSLWSPQYLGAAGLLLALLAWASRRDEAAWPAAEVRFWGLAALLSAWLALGDKGILFEAVYRLPGWGLFRQQERLMGIFSLSLTLLASMGCAAWLRQGERTKRPLQIIGLLWAGAMLLSALTLAVTGAERAIWWAIWLRQAALGGAALVLLGTFGGVRRGTLLVGAQHAAPLQPAPLSSSRWRGAALLALLAVDLYLVSLSIGSREPGAPAQYWPIVPAFEALLAEQEPWRLDSEGAIHANLGEVYGLEDLTGISPLRPKAWSALRDLGRRRAWQLAGVRYVLSAEPRAEAGLTLLDTLPLGTIPRQNGALCLYRFEDALPRARLVYETVRVPDDAAAWVLLRDESFDPGAQVILSANAPQLPLEGGLEDGGVVRTRRLDVRTLQITVDTPRDGYLVVSEWRYPGWRATLDGQPTAIYGANAGFQAIYLPAGPHEVRLRYTTWEVGLGGLIALLTLLLGGLTAWRWRPAPKARAASQCGTQPRAPRHIRWLLATLAGARISSWWAAGLVLLGTALRLITLGSQELRGDEAFSYVFSRLPLGEIVPALLREGDPHSPLHYVLLHGWMRLFGESEFALRLPALIPGVLLIALMWRLGIVLADRRQALLLALLTALSQALVWVSQDVRNQYTLAMALAAGATLVLLRAIQRPSWGLWLAYGLLSALCIYGFYYGVFALLAHACYLLCDRGTRRHLAAWIASGLLALALFAPWLAAMWPRLAAAGQLSDAGQPELANYLVRVGIWAALGAEISRSSGRWLALGGGAVVLMGLRALWRERRPSAVLMGVWLASAAWAIFLVQFSRATFSARYIAVAAPAGWFLFVAGVAALVRAAGARRLVAWLALLAILGTNVAGLYVYYTDPDAGRSAGYRPAAAHIAAAALPGDLLVTNFPDPCWDYYLRDAPLTRTMLPVKPSQSREAVEARLAELGGAHERLWFAPVPSASWDADGMAQHWLDYHALLEERTLHGKQTVLRYRPLRTAQQVMRPLEAPFGESIVLLGCHVTVDGLPMSPQAEWLALRPGAVVQVTLLWEGRAAMARDYTGFVHLVGDDGRLLAQHDGVPVFGSRPTSTWAAGDLVLDRHEVAVPDGAVAQQGALLVGLYASDTIVRVPLPDGRDALDALRVSIAP
jgi:hypothetical protein